MTKVYSVYMDVELAYMTQSESKAFKKAMELFDDDVVDEVKIIEEHLDTWPHKDIGYSIVEFDAKYGPFK